MELNERENIIEGKKYKDILSHYGEEDIAVTLNNYSAYDLMGTIAWLSGPQRARYYTEFLEAKNDKKKLDETIKTYTERAKQLLEHSGYEKEEISAMLPEFTGKIMNLHCNPGFLNLMFRDYIDPEVDMDKYHNEYLEALEKKGIDNLPYTIKNNGDEIEYLENKSK